MNEWEVINAAKHNIGDPSIETLLDALEAYYLNGVPDDQAGDVEASTGHFYRVDRWIVVTNSQGFKDVRCYADEQRARAEFYLLDSAYADWCRQDDVVTFGDLSESGLTNVRMIKQSAIKQCPHVILVPEHYRPDGSCRCDDPAHEEMSEWGYEWRDSRWVAEEEA